MLPVIILLCTGAAFGILKRKENISETSPYIIGLTGLPCSGKGEVSKIFQQLGAIAIDVDKLGHTLLEKRDIIENIYNNFGEKVLTSDEKISRTELGKIVFNNPEKLKKLETILHPAMITKIQETIEILSPEDILILDAAILHKMKLHKICNKVIVVYSDENLRVNRAAQRNWSKDELFRRDEAVRKQLELNDISLIENNHDTITLKNKIKSIWNKDILNER